MWNRPLIWWWWGNRVVFQRFQSSAFWFQPVLGPSVYFRPEVIILHLGGSLSSSKLRVMYQTVTHVPPGGTRLKSHPALLFSLHSLTPLVTVWMCPLEHREGLGDGSLFPINRKWGTKKGLCTWGRGETTGSCTVSIPHFLWYFSILRGGGGLQF